jgi:hypothetical protein
MQDPEIPRWAFDNRRWHVKAHRSAQRDFREAEYGRTARYGNRRIPQEEENTSSWFPMWIQQVCHQRDGTSGDGSPEA